MPFLVYKVTTITKGAENEKDTFRHFVQLKRATFCTTPDYLYKEGYNQTNAGMSDKALKK